MHTNHDEAPNSDVNPVSLKQGHEPDRIDVKPILYVGAVLLVTFIVTYTTVTMIVNSLRATSTETPNNPIAAKRSESPLKDRVNRISSSDPRAEVKQPRLEGAERLKGEDPAWVRSTERTEDGNSPHYHPEDLRPSSDLGKKLGLQDYAWADKEKSVVRLPIEQAIKLLSAGSKAEDAGSDAKKLYLKVLKFEDKVKPEDLRKLQPTQANPHLGIVPKATPKEAAKGGGH